MTSYPSLAAKPPLAQTTASKLSRLSSALFHAIDDRNFSFQGKDAQELVAHIASDFRARSETYATDERLRTWDEQVDMWKSRTRDFPNSRLRVLEASAIVDKNGTSAAVYVSAKLSGFSTITLYPMNVLRWRRVVGSEEWVCCSLVSMRGNPGDVAVPFREEGIEEKIERLSRGLVDAVNVRDFESLEAQELVRHISKDWKAQMDTFARENLLLCWPQQVEAWKQRAKENPGVHFTLLDISSSVDEEMGVADVFMGMEVTGISDVTLHAMNELKWKRVSDEWQFYYLIGMRGSVGNAGL